MFCAAQGRDDDVLVTSGTEPASYPKKGTAPASWYLPSLYPGDPKEPHSRAWPRAWHRHTRGREHFSNLLSPETASPQLSPWARGEYLSLTWTPPPPPYLLPAWLFMDGGCSCVHTVHLFCFLCWFYKNYNVINTACEIFK